MGPSGIVCRLPFRQPAGTGGLSEQNSLLKCLSSIGVLDRETMPFPDGPDATSNPRWALNERRTCADLIIYWENRRCHL